MDEIRKQRNELLERVQAHDAIELKLRQELADQKAHYEKVISGLRQSNEDMKTRMIEKEETMNYQLTALQDNLIRERG